MTILYNRREYIHYIDDACVSNCTFISSYLTINNQSVYI